MTGNLHLVSEETSNIESFLFYRALVECCQQNELPDLVIIDGEPNHLIGQTYAPDLYKTASDSTIANIQFDNQLQCHQLDIMLDLAMSGNQVFVNVPMASFSIIDDWLSPVDLKDLVDTYSVKLWRWFVTDGTTESIEALKESYQNYGGLINHLIVKKEGGYRNMTNSWFTWKNDAQLQSYLATFPTHQFMMPTLYIPDYRWDVIKKNRLSFTTAKTHGHSAVTLLEKQKIHTWLQTMFNHLSLIPWDKFESKSDFDSFDENELSSIF